MAAINAASRFGGMAAGYRRMVLVGQMCLALEEYPC